MSKRPKVCQWFVQPVNSFTNTVLQCLCPPEDFGKVKVEKDGKLINVEIGVWQCPHQVIQILNKGDKKKLLYRIYVRHKNIGPVEPWKF